MKILLKESICIVFLMCLGLGGSTAETRALCETYKGFYESGIKQIGLADAEGIGDSSVPRATVRELKQIRIQLSQLILLQQMNAHGCDIPKTPSNLSIYPVNVMGCGTEYIAGNYDSPKCDTDTWKKLRDYENLK